MIYLDHNATTPLHPAVLEEMTRVLALRGNPSSAHEEGRRARWILEEARLTLARFLHTAPEEILFTSGGTESNNTVLQALPALAARRDIGKPHLITSAVEHPSVLETAKTLRKRGIAEVTFLPVDPEGRISPEALQNSLRPETALISLMHGNNEIGTIQDIRTLGGIAREAGIPFHTDAVQTFGKIPLDMKDMPIDYLSLSAHKIYGPKGAGVLFRRTEAPPLPALLQGGHQEKGRRAGTENLPALAGLAAAVVQRQSEMAEEAPRLEDLRNRLVEGISQECAPIQINSPQDGCLPGTANLSFLDIEGEALLLQLDLRGIAVSTGSACSTGSLEPSHVLTALGSSPEQAHSSLRFSLGRETTPEDIDQAVQAVRESAQFLRSMSPLVPAD